MENENELKIVLLELLNAIQSGDVETYNRLSDEELTCFEPETNGNPVDGLAFHQFFMENSVPKGKYHIELVRPIFRFLSDDVAYTTYSLLVNRLVDGEFKIKSVNETRIFKKIDDNWKMMHFHRS